MRRCLCGVVALTLSVSVGAPTYAQKGKFGREQGGNFGWLSSLSEGKAQARKTGKPLMVVIRCVP
jgi:hypothetical protein